MRTFRFALLAACLAPLAPAALAATPAVQRALPAPVLTDEQRTLYRNVFAAIRASDWATAAARLDATPEGPLHHAARAELYLAKGSPKVELAPLLSLVAKGAGNAASGQLARLSRHPRRRRAPSRAPRAGADLARAASPARLAPRAAMSPIRSRPSSSRSSSR
jgi:hypothetical protein